MRILDDLIKKHFSWNGSDIKDRHELNDHELQANSRELSEDNFLQACSTTEMQADKMQL